ncbi:P-loop containing nucleoside triphosphate hydrolase protein [Gorgonomyces haynaldii]|nr:P-loop containing nucleoside triphosphate hydrolase protein [Gorgonomyces haynaldii]
MSSNSISQTQRPRSRSFVAGMQIQIPQLQHLALSPKSALSEDPSEPRSHYLSTASSNFQAFIMDTKSCHVAVRVRPPTTEEAAVWNCENGRIEYTDPESGRKREPFNFDSTFTGSDNRTLYQNVVQQAVHDAMQGIDATVFAYGQTASGKTYSMMGTEQQPGIIPQAVDDVFQYIKQQESSHEFLLRVSYLEIYNETLRDLLAPEVRELRILDHGKRGIIISPLKEEVVTSPVQLMKIISRGENNRSVFSTENNVVSSRSHTIFTLTIESKSNEQQESLFISYLNLIDLAGSEKATQDMDRRKEGAFINKSLLTLGNVIAKITEGGRGHIPFRDSKLTRLLQPSLSGSTRICVIATINPSVKNLEESLSTLKFAQRVKKLKIKPESHMVVDEKGLIKRYQHEIDELREELSKTMRQLEKKEDMVEAAAVQQYQQKLEEAQLQRTILMGRIDYLTKLILNSANLQAKPLLDWSKKPERSSVVIAEGLLPSEHVSRSVPNLSADPVLKVRDELSQRAFQHMQTKDEQLNQLKKLFLSIKEGKEDPKSLISAFESKTPKLPGQESILDLFSVQPPPTIDNDAEELKQQIKELEVVAEEQVQQITLLKGDLEKAKELQRFSDMEIKEMKKALEEKQEALNLFTERFKLLEETKSHGILTESTIDFIVSLGRSCIRYNLEPEWGILKQELKSHLSIDQPSPKKSPVRIADLEAELEMFEEQLGSNTKKS